MNYLSRFKLSKFFLGIGFAIIAYMIYALTASFYGSYILDRHIENFRKKNQEIEEKYRGDLENLKYYRSKSYAEKVAKEELNLLLPGEEAIILLGDDLVQKGEQELKDDAKLKFYRSLSRPQKWWYYFFRR